MPVKAKTSLKKGEATIVTTLRITSIVKTSNDQEAALDEVAAHQKKMLSDIKNLKSVDDIQLINERKFLNLK